MHVANASLQVKCYLYSWIAILLVYVCSDTLATEQNSELALAIQMIFNHI